MEQLKIKNTLVDVNDEYEVVKIHDDGLEEKILRTVAEADAYCRDGGKYYRLYLDGYGKLKLDIFDVSRMSEAELGVFTFLCSDFTDDFEGK